MQPLAARRKGRLAEPLGILVIPASLGGRF